MLWAHLLPLQLRQIGTGLYAGVAQPVIQNPILLSEVVLQVQRPCLRLMMASWQAHIALCLLQKALPCHCSRSGHYPHTIRAEDPMHPPSTPPGLQLACSITAICKIPEILKIYHAWPCLQHERDSAT